MRTSLKTQTMVAGWMTKSELAEARKRAAAWQAAFEERQPKSAVDTLGVGSAPVQVARHAARGLPGGDGDLRGRPVSSNTPRHSSGRFTACLVADIARFHDAVTQARVTLCSLEALAGSKTSISRLARDQL